LYLSSQDQANIVDRLGDLYSQNNSLVSLAAPAAVATTTTTISTDSYSADSSGSTFTDNTKDYVAIDDFTNTVAVFFK